MPIEVRFYECTGCYEQYESWSQAEACEWEHHYAKEQAAWDDQILSIENGAES